MRSEDLEKLAEMKARRESEEAIIAFFKMQGYPEEEVREAFSSTPEAEMIEESEPMQVTKLDTKKRGQSHIIIAIVLLVVFVGCAVYFLFPFLPDIPGVEQNKTQWKVSAVPIYCSSTRAALKVTNADIAGMPVTQFTIKENNATCSPPTNLQSTGIGATITCYGTFEDEKVYTLTSPVSIDDGFICRYQ